MWCKGMAVAGFALMAAWVRAGQAAPVCDGRHDATAALNAMLAAGGQVRLPAGTCLVSDSLIVRSGSVVRGAGIGRTVIKASPTPEYPVISIGSTRGGASNVDLSGLTVDGSGTRIMERRNSDGVLVFNGADRIRIHDLEVQGAGRNGIRVIGRNIEISGSSVHDNFANGIFAVGSRKPGAVVRTENVRVLSNRVMHNSLGGLPPGKSWDGIDIDPAASNCTVEDNTVIGNDIILLEDGKSVPSSTGNQVLNNTILDSPENGIDVSGAETDFRLVGNRIERVRGAGILINGPVVRGLIQSNTILETTKPGILVDNWISFLPGAPREITIVGNTVDPGRVGGRSPAIALRAGASDIRIMANRLSSYGINTSRAGPGVVAQGNR